MARPRFSEMLVTTRRKLGLSIEQASSVLRLKQSVLIAFEEGDFDLIPRSGYAQGMLSSYARYLGLNPRMVTDQYAEDLLAHINGGEVPHTRRGVANYVDNPTYEVPGTGFQSGGEFRDTTTSMPKLRGGNTPDPQYRSTSLVNPQTGARPYTTRTPGSRPGRAYAGVAGRPETSRREEQPTYRQELAPRNNPGARRTSGGRASGRSQTPRRGQIATRDVNSRQFTDDLRFENEASSYESASTLSGRRGSRNIANPERPNVRRRNTSGTRQQLRGRRPSRKPSRGGVIGFLQEFFSDQRRTMITVCVALVVILMLIITLSVRSCTSAASSTEKATVGVTTVGAATTSAATTASSAASAATTSATTAAATTAATTAAATTAAVVEPTNVTVSVADGQVSWLEIQSDGKSEIAETVTGPWEQTYTVKQSITVQAADPTAVSITKNNSKVQFDSRTAGVGTVTIAGTDPEKAAAEAAEAAAAAATASTAAATSTD